ncbi:MAG: hypothetical protein U0531_18960 [Dehalococcoidia bacterium]
MYITMRMGMRRFIRLTNAFPKKVEKPAHAVALHFMYCNFARMHKALNTTPAIAGGMADHSWTVREVAPLRDRDSKLTHYPGIYRCVTMKLSKRASMSSGVHPGATPSVT